MQIISQILQNAHFLPSSGFMDAHFSPLSGFQLGHPSLHLDFAKVVAATFFPCKGHTYTQSNVTLHVLQNICSTQK